MAHALSFEHLLFRHTRPHPRTSPATQPKQGRPRTHRNRGEDSEPVACPHCGHTAGFLLDVDDFAYRVLEDDQDTELLGGLEDDTPLCCTHCDTAITLVQALAIAHTPGPAHSTNAAPSEPTSTHRWGFPSTLKGHPHDAGAARVRTPRHGPALPACPQCPRNHGFLADVDGVAYHVLEDDDDTQLLAEADNLLCPDCGAVFPTHTAPAGLPQSLN